MQDNNKDLFERIGIDISKDKINIDMNQTKDFFNSLKTLLDDATQNIKNDLADGKVDLGENVGIKIDKENINIDLTKTKSFIEDFGSKIEHFLQEIDIAVKNIDKK